MKNRVDAFLTLMYQMGASDLCISTGQRVTVRVSGAIEALRYPPIDRDAFRRMLIPIVRDGKWAKFEEEGDLDLAYEVPDVARFRVNIFKHEDGYGSVFRSIPTKILTMRDLNFPESIARIPHFRSGMVLMTGPTGSGKSTTLAAIIHEINLNRPNHIITIEDPLEFVHKNRRCRFSQREIGTHAHSFADALRSAIREDPDVVLVGELRDLETIRMALKAAETGLLVFSTLHTNTAIKTVDRVVTVFSSDEQESVRRILADTLRAVVSQQLIPKLGGGRVAAHEILFGSPALGALIREGKTSQIVNLIQTGRGVGMIDMDSSILELVQSRKVAPEAAFEKAIHKDKFRRKLDAVVASLGDSSGVVASEPDRGGEYDRVGSSSSARRREPGSERDLRPVSATRDEVKRRTPVPRKLNYGRPAGPDRELSPVERSRSSSDRPRSPERGRVGSSERGRSGSSERGGTGTSERHRAASSERSGSQHRAAGSERSGSQHRAAGSERSGSKHRAASSERSGSKHRSASSERSGSKHRSGSSERSGSQRRPSRTKGASERRKSVPGEVGRPPPRKPRDPRRESGRPPAQR